MRTRIIFFFFHATLAAAFPFLLLYVFYRILRDRRYLRRLEERFGFWRLKQRTPPGAVWLHAVSVGEALSAVEVIRRLRAELPHTPVYVSCTTLAGRDVAEAKLGGIADGVFYAPIDTRFAVRSVLRKIRPSVLVILETEIWPNLFREAKWSGASVLVVNARISDKAARKYDRFRWFFQAVFEHVDEILAQSSQDQQRFIAAGAAPDRVRVAGNLKYDFEPALGSAPQVILGALRKPLWIAASTTGPMWEGDTDEDDEVITAQVELMRRMPDLQLLIAPRKPERFDVVEAKLRTAGLSYVRRTALQGGESASVLLLDSLGELGMLFPQADVVFMGGTLASRGGHNILEPALCGKPVVAGPHLENFAAIRDRFSAARGYIPIENAGQLREAVEGLLRDPGQRDSLGARAKALSETERGATARALRVIREKRWEYVPRSLPWYGFGWILGILSEIWIAGGRIKRALTKTRALSTPVISVGGIAMGGVGKTPMVRYLAEALRSRGYKPAVLTRGYRRRSRDSVCLAMGTDVPTSLTGDEARLLLRSSDVGVGADRWSTGIQMEQQFHPDVFLLDDGFQHKRLHRTIDIVLLDAFDPLAGRSTFPLGRLREPVSALQRADLLVITRAGQRRFDGLRRLLPDIPLFFADVEASGWFPEPPPLHAVAAFCGLGNPHTFVETLRAAGAHIMLTRVFSDHHRYSAEELRDLARLARSQGASVLITTEKDWMNLPPDAQQLVSPLKLYCIEVRTRLRNEPDFLTKIDSLLGQSAQRNHDRAGQ